MRPSRSTAALLVLALIATGCTWSQYRFGPNRAGYNPVEVVIGADNVGELEIRWRGASGLFRDTNAPVVADGYLYSTTRNDLVEAYDLDACEAATTGTCAPSFSFDVGVLQARDHSIADEILYTSGPTLEAFDATGQDNCSGTPIVCTPLWTTTGAPFMGSPTVFDDRVYVVGGSFAGSTLLVYDALGEQNCSGAPRVCTPLWRAALGPASGGVPSIARGRVYVAHDNQVSIFDAAGQQGCDAGLCSPLWTVTPTRTADTQTTIAVSGNWAYGAGYAFASDGCGAAVCAPGWSIGTGPVATAKGVIVIGGGRVMDADGIDACVAPQTGCTDLWRVSTGAFAFSEPMIANGVIYAWWSGLVGAYDLTGCGQPVCSPLWSISAAAGDGDNFGAPIVADGWLYTVDRDTDEILAVSLPPAP